MLREIFCRYMTTNRRIENEIIVKKKEEKIVQSLSFAVFTEKCWLRARLSLKPNKQVEIGFAPHRNDKKPDLP